MIRQNLQVHFFKILSMPKASQKRMGLGFLVDTNVILDFASGVRTQINILAKI